MSIFRGFTMLVVLMLCVAPTIAQKDRITMEDRITIYVSGPIYNGFIHTNKDVQDSIKDISNRLKKKKELRLVYSQEDADINLTVISRGYGRNTFGHRLVYTEHYDEKEGYDGKHYERTILVEKEPMVSGHAWVATVLEIGQYRQEIVGYHVSREFGHWGACARHIVNDVKAWAVTNREQLMQRRKISQP